MKRLSPLVCVVSLVACGSSGNHDADPDSGEPSRPRRDAGIVDLSIPGDPGYDAGWAVEGGSADAAGDAGDAGDAEYERPLPENVSFETASRILPDESPPLQDERYAEQVDYFVFAAERGAFYEISTDRDIFSPDNVISVYDGDRVLLAENDDGSLWAGDSIDARVIIRAAADGDIYVKVEDPYTTAEFFTESTLPLLFYHPRVRKIAANMEGFALESASGPAPASFATDATSDYRYVTLVGSRGTGEDTFAFRGVTNRVLAARLLGMEKHVSTREEAWASARLLDAQAHVLGQIESSLGQATLNPPITDANYELHVRTNEDPQTAGDFYALDVVLIPDNAREVNDVANNTSAGADAIPFVGTFPRRGLLLATVPSGDVDYYRLPLATGERVAVDCEAESGGSRVRGLQAAVVDEAGVVLGTGMESPTKSLAIDPITPPAAATYYLRLSSSTPVGEFADAAWTRCLVRVGA